MSKPVRVLIAEDDVLMREGSRGCFWRQGWRSSVERVTRSFRRKALAHRPDVAVVDIQLPPGRGDDGLRAALELRGRLPNTGVLVLSQYYDERDALDLIGESAEGVGCLLKERAGEVEVFTDALARVAAGGTALDPEVVGRVLGRRRGGAAR